MDGMTLSGPAGRGAGSAFKLASPAPVTATHARDDGWTVQIMEGVSSIITSGGAADGYPTVWHVAYGVVQEALDVWSIGGQADLHTEEPYGNHVTYWADDGGPVVRFVGRSYLGADMGGGPPVVTDADGTQRNAPVPQIDGTDDPRRDLPPAMP